MALALKQEENTIEDIYNLPEGERAELIDGQMYMMAPPTRLHQRYVGALHYFIFDYIRKKGGPCKVDIAPCGVYLFDDDKTYVEPDIFVVCDPEKVDDICCHGAPDWIIEVQSPGTRKYDGKVKRNLYKTAGVREFWIIDPETETVQVWDYENRRVGLYTFDQTIPVGIYDDELEIDFSKFDI